MADQLSDAVQQVVTAAGREARTLRHDHIGTEHLLLGVLTERDKVGARALDALGLTLPVARAAVMRAVGLPDEPSPPRLPITPPARDALAGALREAIELGRTSAGPEHVLLALLRERDGVGVRVLLGAGVDPRRLREEVRALADAESEPGRGDPEAGTGAGERSATEDAEDAAAAYALLGVLGTGGPVAALLRSHGVDEAAVRALLADGRRRSV